MSRFRAAVIWIALVLVVTVSIVAAAMSPQLAWRDPVYIGAGFAGVIALVLVLFQPLLAAGLLPGLAARRGRNLHRWVGAMLFLAVVIHVAGLWITSPPDVIDALLFASPTPFSIWGVIAMWSVFAAACLAALRRRLSLRPRTWRISHKTLVAVIGVGSVVHAWLIEGTMELFSKALLCLMILAAMVAAFVHR